MVVYSQPADNSVVGKVFCGYQAWFNCKGDGSPRDTWAHWGGNPPRPGDLTFEVYPDVTDYAASSLFQSGFAALGDGQPAKLFSSYREDVIDVHGAWMQKYGIDGVALQRFLGPVLSSASIKANRDSIAVRLRRTSEKYGTLYYLMYDMTPDNVDGFKGDVEHMEADLKFMDSPNYANQDGKPVICLWGIGFDHRDDAGYNTNSQTIIDWLHGKGYYVIGGVPSRWRQTNGDGDVAIGYEDVFASLDMISPWTPGRYRHVSGADDWRNDFLVPDKAKCDELGIDYQPVIFSGFAWSNWNGGDANSYPRHKGEFLWAQVANIANLEIPSMYVAMFDEYDEGTNIMKMADSYMGIPTDQYFLTSSADGSYISSDFYLRLVGKATRVLKGEDPVTAHVTIPFSEGPIYFRTSHEPGYDALPDWKDTPDEIGVLNVDALKCAHVSENPYLGSYSLKFEGTDNSDSESHAAMKLFDVDIPVFDDTKLMFLSYPTNENSRYASVELVLTDGTTLSSAGAEDTRGQPMLPSSGRGEINEWTKTICRIGEWLDSTSVSRDTIDRIVVVYDQAAGTGDIVTYFDNISIYRLETDEVEIDNATIEIPDIKTQMDPGESLSVSVTAINTGTSPWTAARGYKLATRNPENNTIWGINRVELGTDSIPSGEKKTFTFDITAPGSLGKYNFQWQMIRETAGEEAIWVGEMSENVVVTVGDIDGTNFTEIYEGIITRRAEINDGESAEKAFDNLYTDGEKNVDWSKWLDNGGVPSVGDPSWIQIEFPDSVTVDLLAIVSGNDFPARDPEDFVLKGSNDDSTWTEIGSWEGQVWSGRFEEKLLPLVNTGAFRFYRLEITRNNGDESLTQLCEIKMTQVGVFLSLPEKATEPNPADEAITVDEATNVSWTPGDNTAYHDLYFGTSNPPPYVGNQLDSVLDPGVLQYNTTYFWRVNEKNNDGTKVGDIWSFTTEIAFSDAAFVSQNIPEDTLHTGESMSVDVVLKNTGESTWDSASGQFSLGSQNPENNNEWGISKVFLANEELVLPGDEITFAFNVIAPDTPGEYNFQWKMQNQDGWFGASTDNVLITVYIPVGIEQRVEENQILISNPANSGIIMVQVDYIEEPLVISIFSIEGKMVHQTKSSALHTEINISEFNQGLYLVRVQNRDMYNKALILLE
ncbi:MAG: T9SS type A sorting domain-containing protein [Bacteroidetes bacterium]|nr:T9SS type A sorting domain-containing protein [Bacteroidota bacterium]